MTLTTLARRAHPINRRHAAKYVLALRWMRARNLWILDRFGKAPKWATPQ